MNVLFLFGSMAQTIRFATLTLSLTPNELYYGETNVTIDYIFSGTTTTARWLFTLKMWTVFYQVPQIFQGDELPKDHIKLFRLIGLTGICTINIPWLILAIETKEGSEFIN
jgi:hypothetical protein